MVQKIVMIDDGEGNLSPYIRYSARLPEFLDKYPLSAGYRVVSEFTDLLSIAPGLASLLSRMIAEGRDIHSLKIPNLGDLLVSLICTSNLYGPNQNAPLRTASALSPIRDLTRDFEVLETAANQRLLAAVGIGGTLFDTDEDQARLLALTQPAGGRARSNGSAPTTIVAEPTPSNRQSAAAGPAAESGTAAPAASATASTAAGAAPQPPARAPAAPTKAQLTQIAAICKRLGRDPAEVYTKQGADEMLAELGRLEGDQLARDTSATNGSSPAA